MRYNEKRIQELILYYNKIIIKRIGKEKIRQFKKKRWEEHIRKNKYKPDPTQEYYNKVKEWKQY